MEKIEMMRLLPFCVLLPLLLPFCSAQSPPTTCPLNSIFNGVSASSSYPSDGNFQFQLCSGFSGNRFDASSTPTCRVGDKIPLYFLTWASYLNYNYVNYTLTTPVSASFPYMAFTSESQIQFVGSKFLPWSSNSSFPFYYSYAFNDSNATQLQLMLNPVQIGASPSAISDVEFAFFAYVMVVNSPDIAAQNGQLLNVSAVVEMLDQVGNKYNWVADWSCTFSYDLPLVANAVKPSFSFNGPPTLMVGAVDLWYLNVTSFDLLNVLYISIMGPNNDSTIFDILNVSYSASLSSRAFSHLPGVTTLQPIGVSNFSVGSGSLFGVPLVSSSFVSWSGQITNARFREGQSSNASDNTATIVIAGQLLSGAANNTNYTLTVIANDVSANWSAGDIYVFESQFVSVPTSFNASTDYMVVTPTVKAYSNVQQVKFGGVIPVYVNLTTTAFTSNYQVEVGANQDGVPVLSVLSMRVVSAGVNYFSVVPKAANLNYSNTPGWNDVGVLYLGPLTNTLLSPLADANTIVVEVQLQATNNATLISSLNGTQRDVVLGVRYNIGQSNELINVSIVSLVVSSNTQQASPTFNWLNKFYNTIVLGGPAHFWLEGYVPPMQTVSPLTVSVALPTAYVNGSAVPTLSVYRVQVGYVGSYIVGLTPFQDLTAAGWITYTRSVQFNSSNSSTSSSASASWASVSSPSWQNGTTYVSLTVPFVTSVGRFQYDWEALASTFRIEFLLQATPNNLSLDLSQYPAINNTAFWAAVRVSYPVGNVWSSLALLTLVSSFYTPVNVTSVSVQNIYPSTPRVGQVFNADLNVTLARMTQSVPLTVSLTARNTSVFSILRVRFRTFGANYIPAYFVNSAYSACPGSTLSSVGNYSGDCGSATTSLISNIGTSLATPYSSYTAADTFSVSCAFLVRPDATLVAGSLYRIDFNVTTQTLNGVFSFLGSIIVNLNSALTFDTGVHMYPISYAVRNPAAWLVRGGAVDIVVNVSTSPNTLVLYGLLVTVNYNFTGSGHANSTVPIPVDVRLTSAGDNLPSAVDAVLAAGKLPVVSLNSTTEMMNATSRWPFFNMGDYERMNSVSFTAQPTLVNATNILQFETIVCLPISYGASLPPTMNISYRIQASFSGQLATANSPQFTVANVPSLSDAVQTPLLSLLPANSSIVYVNAATTWLANVTVLAETTMDMTLTIASPVDTTGQASFVFSNPRVFWRGTNVPCVSSLNFTSSSSVVYNQLNVLSVSFVLTNTQYTKRSQWGPYVAGSDDTVLIAFDVNATDTTANVYGSAQMFTATLSSSLANASVVANTTGIIQCSSPCTPILSFSTSTPDASAAPMRSIINMSVTLSHTPNSTSDAFFVSLYHYLPPFLSLHSVNISNQTAYGPTSATIVNQYTLVTNITRIPISDSVTVTIFLVLDPNSVLPPNIGLQSVVVPVDMSYYTNNGNKSTPGSYPAAGTFNYFAYGIHQTTITVPECQFRLGLDVTNSTIQDCQISASSSLPSSNATHCRLNNPNTWISAPRNIPGNEYLQIRLTGQTRVTGVILQPSASDNTYFVTTLSFQFSQDSNTWFDYLSNSTGAPYVMNTSPTSSGSTYMLPSGLPIVASYIRIIPLSNSKSNTMHPVRIELLGCVLTPGSDLCTPLIPITVPVSDYYERGYLLLPSAGNLYVCISASVGTVPTCSFTSDKGASWSPVDSHVANIQFYVNSTQTLYGTAWDQVSRMASFDFGYSWYGIMDGDYASALTSCGSQSCIQAKVLPWQDWSNMNDASLYSQFGLTDGTNYYGVNQQGICFVSSNGAGSCSSYVAYW